MHPVAGSRVKLGHNQVVDVRKILNLSTIRMLVRQKSEGIRIFNSMEMHILDGGSLNVKAREMIRPLSLEEIREFYLVDDRGNIRLAMNILLLNHRGRLILFDPGIAGFLPERLKQQYGLEIRQSLEEQLDDLGYGASGITDVVFTHLHFDHGSGALKRVPGRIEKRFPEAAYHAGRAHFEYSRCPDRFESDSFFSTFLKRVEGMHWLEDWDQEWMEFRFFRGHTREMAVPVIHTPEGDILYATDLVPMELFLKPGTHSGYDLEPELAVREKEKFLGDISESVQERPVRLVLFHEPLNPVVEFPGKDPQSSSST